MQRINYLNKLEEQLCESRIDRFGRMLDLINASYILSTLLENNLASNLSNCPLNFPHINMRNIEL